MAGGQFLFNNSIWVSSGLSYSFTRKAQTVDPTGAAKGKHAARFDSLMLLAGVETLSDLEGGGWSVLDSGFGLDSATPLLVVHNVGGGKLRVYSGTGFTTYLETTLTLCSVPTSGSPNVYNGLILDDPYTAYVPQAACVCHGFIALWCMALTLISDGDPPLWRVVGSAMVVSQSAGASASWELLFDDLLDPVQNGVYRGAHWSLQKYCVPYPEENGDVLEAWLVPADYHLDSATSTTAADGGRFFPVRITRDAVGAGHTWTPGDGDGIAVMFDMDDLTAYGYRNSRHAHAGGVVAWSGSESDGVRFVGSLGDDLAKNRLVTALLEDHAGHYTDVSDWSFSDQYHGRSQNLGVSTDSGIYSPQPVGFLQARAYLSTEDPEALFIGADNTAESISLIRCPHADGTLPTIEWINGVDTGYSSIGGHWFDNVFQLRTMAPELGTPIIAWSNEDLGSVNSARYWYQPGAGSSALLGLWASCMVTRYDSNAWAVPYGDYIVVSGYVTPGLHYRNKPEVKAHRPLILSPGGRNMLKSKFLFETPSGSAHTVEALNYDTGGWYELDGTTHVYLDPQPPSLCDQVLKIKTAQSSDNLIGTLRVSTTSSTSNNETGWTTGSNLRQFRFLVMDNSASNLAALPQPSTSLVSLSLRDDTTTSVATHSKGRVSNHKRWMAHTLAYDAFTMSNGPRILMRTSEATTSTPSNTGYFYLAGDLAKDGQGSFTYPQPPQTVTSGWDAGPDELFDITGFGLNSSFTLLIAGMMPGDDWNHRTPRTDNYWPLFTLWGDEDNWIEFGAVTDYSIVDEKFVDAGAFRIKYVADGTPGSFDWPRDTNADLVKDLYWARNSQLLVGFSYDPSASTDRLKVLGSLGGDAPRDGGPPGSLPNPLFTTGFDTLKFRGAANEVVTWRIFGGKAISGSALPATGSSSMATLFKSLGFLD